MKHLDKIPKKLLNIIELTSFRIILIMILKLSAILTLYFYLIYFCSEHTSNVSFIFVIYDNLFKSSRKYLWRIYY
jgi:uncharacterized membrane protein